MIFDRHVVVDWSAANASTGARPRKDAIWIGVGGEQDHYFPTRDDATRWLERLLGEGDRVLVGFDFPLGYPRGFADVAFPGSDPAWRRTLDGLQVQDRVDNRNDRFAVAAEINRRASSGATHGPFWGRPGGLSLETLKPGKVAGGPRFPFVTAAGIVLEEFRACDRVVRARRRGIASAFQLHGAGSVGGQALVGIPRVRALRDILGGAIWPFEGGFAIPRARIVYAEVWPSLVPRAPDPIKDRAQVRALSGWLRAHDREGTLRSLFEQPETISDHERAACIAEEGFILGVR